MMEILHARQLSLSRKKSCMGLIKDGFHYLGVSYSSTQPENKTEAIYANDVRYLDNMGGGRSKL